VTVARATVVAEYDLGLEAVHPGRRGNLDAVGGGAGVKLRLKGIAKALEGTGAAGEGDFGKTDAVFRGGHQRGDAEKT
jgi:hypothetical protein